MKYLWIFLMTGGMVWAAERSPLTRLELKQAQERKRMLAEQQAEYRALLQGQIESLTRLRKEFVRVGNQIEAAEAAQALAQLRKLTDFKPPEEKKKLIVEAVVADKPAVIKPMHLKATRLKEYGDQEKGRWMRVPNALMGASIYDLPTAGTNGVADFKVTRGGQVYLALNYDYQGNNGGGWTEERWMPEDFMAAGWAQVRGVQMVAWSNRTYMIFTRQVEKGEQFRLRCNKYEPPYVILLDGGKAAKQAEKNSKD